MAGICVSSFVADGNSHSAWETPDILNNISMAGSPAHLYAVDDPSIPATTMQGNNSEKLESQLNYYESKGLTRLSEVISDLVSDLTYPDL